MTVENINSIIIIGAGTMGPGMAATFARNGYTTTLSDIDTGQIEKARGAVDFVFSAERAHESGPRDRHALVELAAPDSGDRGGEG